MEAAQVESDEDFFVNQGSRNLGPPHPEWGLSAEPWRTAAKWRIRAIVEQLASERGVMLHSPVTFTEPLEQSLLDKVVELAFDKLHTASRRGLTVWCNDPEEAIEKETVFYKVVRDVLGETMYDILERQNTPNPLYPYDMGRLHG